MAAGGGATRDALAGDAAPSALPESVFGRRVQRTFAEGVCDGVVTATRLSAARGRVWRVSYDADNRDAGEWLTDTCIRIAFALNNIARGTDILLDPFTQLVSSSSKAQANVAEWATGLYHAPPPAGGGSRPGLAFLQKLVGEKEAEAKAEERTAL
jgi:hypothetical protein